MEYLKKFNKLPKELREVVSSSSATKTAEDLEKKYGVDLAAVIIQIMTKDIAWQGLEDYLARELKLAQKKAGELKAELENGIFANVKRYLGIESGLPAVATALQAGELKINNKELRMSNGEQTIRNNSPKVLPSEIKQEESKNKTGLDEVARLAGIQDEAMKIRLEKMISIFNKGVRDAIDTRQSLTKEKETGGLGLTLEKAREVVAFIQKNKVEPSAPLPLKPVGSFSSIEQVRDVEYDLSKLAEKNPESAEAANSTEIKAIKKEPVSLKKKINLKEIFKKILPAKPAVKVADREPVKPKIFSPTELSHELPPPPPVISVQKPKVKSSFISGRFSSQTKNSRVESENIGRQIEIGAQRVESERRSENKKLTSAVKVNREQIEPAPINRPQMNDIIRPQTKLQGPVDELANLDLVNFRRLSDDPVEAAKIIKNKVELLEEESFTKRQQGISAWRKSPLYKMYIAAGQQSIQQGKPVEEIIKEAGPGNLDIKQFNAIMELNRTLRV